MTTIFKISALLFTTGILFSCDNKPKETTTTPSVTQTEVTETKSNVATTEKEAPITAAIDGKVQSISSDQFAKQVNDFRKSSNYALKAELPCVVDFYADWCKPCKMIAPFMDEFAQQYKGKINFLKINVDEQPEIANFYQVQAIPTMMFCPKKGDLKTEVGGADKETIHQRIKKYVLK